MVKVECRIVGTEESYGSLVEETKSKGGYLKLTLSKEHIGALLQGKHAVLIGMEEDDQVSGMIDIFVEEESGVEVVAVMGGNDQ